MNEDDLRDLADPDLRYVAITREQLLRIGGSKVPLQIWPQAPAAHTSLLCKPSLVELERSGHAA